MFLNNLRYGVYLKRTPVLDGFGIFCLLFSVCISLNMAHLIIPG